MKNYGLIISPPEKTDYILGGATHLGGEVLVSDGQWDGFLPDNEIQNNNKVETYTCVSFATLNCVEILQKFEYGARTNYSDRFLGKISWTESFKGNTPRGVAEPLRKQGCVEEKEWPFDETINTWEKFYAEIPQKIKTLAVGFFAEYAFGYEAVRSNAKDIMEALKYSPVGFSVYAWVKDADGLYSRPQGMTDNHFTCVYGYEEGKYFKAFDSYLNDGIVLKKIKWESLPMMCMRYTLHKQTVSQSWFDKFISQLKSLLGL